LKIHAVTEPGEQDIKPGRRGDGRDETFGEVPLERISVKPRKFSVSYHHCGSSIACLQPASAAFGNFMSSYAAADGAAALRQTPVG
jgi:hypothetical protein